ncbi:hypothetical protein [Polaribacter sp. IC073]|uniref:hypothetical protein n=1 Tax=Polaribacter sp. IC073 TaxID=2508540 RepID=UPI0011BE0E9B|nr:hypothetical protein [Polaribacter sp. IC073]TXD45729.1 hypothetical protein ES045_16175 [Polaribacter sp. IC073]
MTKLKLSILTITTFILSSIILISCSENDDVNYTNELKTSGTLIFDKGNNKFSLKSNKNKLENTSEHTAELSFISENPIPEFDTNEGLENYLKTNSSNINGTILLKIDEEIVYESIIVNGEKMNSTENDKLYLKKEYPCNYEGIRQCTRDRIDDLNWFDTTLCIIEGFACVANNFVSCGVDNC